MKAKKTLKNMAEKRTVISTSDGGSISASTHSTILRHGLKKKPEFLGLYSYLKTLFPWRSSTFADTIKRNRKLRLAGMLATFGLILLASATIAPLYIDCNYSEALTGAPTLSSTTLTLTASDVSLSISNISPDGSFNASSSSDNISVTTDNYTGYDLTITPAASGTTATQLVNGSNVFNTISSAVTPADFSASTTAAKAYNNLWGILPSKLNGTANTSYQSAPTTASPMTIDSTSSANSTANNYSLNIGARADYTNPTGTYTGTFNIVATAKPPRYAITYDANTTDTVSNLPSPQTSTSASSNQITLSSTTPTRAGYTFVSWCEGTFTTASNGTTTCTGTSYLKGATFYLNQTTPNSTTLYAMWTRNNATYTLSFSADTTDTVTNLPTSINNTNNNGSYTFTLPTTSSSIPTREGYNFLGWAETTGQTTPTYTWSGSSFSPATITVTQTSLSTTSITKTLYAVWKKDGVSIDDIAYMQDFAIGNKDLIASMKADQQYQLTDRRDNKKYYVAKVQTSCDNPRVTAESNGNCYQVWMTQNLDLDLVTTSNFYTHDNTDLGWDTSAFDATKKWTAPSATSTSMWGSTSYTYFGSYNPGDKYYRTSGSTSNESASTSCTQADCPHYHVGNYYTWNAAVANNLSSTNYNVRPDSICPAGWKLPTGLTAASGYSDFNYLLVQQGIATKNVGVGTDATWTTNGFVNIRKDPLFFVRSGYVDSGSLLSAGSYGSYWSSSVNSGLFAYNLFFYSSNVSPANGRSRYLGFPVRCVARDLDLYTITYDANGGTGNSTYQGAAYNTSVIVQNNTFTKDGYVFNGWNTEADGSGTSYAAGSTFTTPASSDGLTLYAQWKVATYMQNLDSSLCTTTASTVYDSRDNQEYTIKRLEDGKCWMMTNLNLGAKTLTTNLTSSNTNLSNTVTAATFNGWKKSTGTGSYTAAEYIPVSGSDATSKTPYGTLYNYCAASAGTICTSSNNFNASYDLCPAGWRLPTGNTSGEFQALYGNSSYNTNAKMRAPESSSGAAFALAGYFGSAAPTNRGSNGYYWSSTRLDGAYMYYLDLNTSNVHPAYNNSRKLGYSIRCVLK